MSDARTDWYIGVDMKTVNVSREIDPREEACPCCPICDNAIDHYEATVILETQGVICLGHLSCAEHLIEEPI